jgi:hypothetical protein
MNWNFRRLAAMSQADLLLLSEAVATLAVSSIAIRLLPFRKVVGGMTAAGAEKSRVSQEHFEHEIRRVRWAVEAAARRVPWRTVCFQKGVALHKMLGRRNITTVLHYGIAQDQDRGLSAHVWVTYAGLPVIGGEEAQRHTCLATFSRI